MTTALTPASCDGRRMAETPLGGSGRSPTSAVPAATPGDAQTAFDRLASHYAKPSATHRSFLYEMLIRGTIQPGSGACLTSGPVAGNQEETNDHR